jgi:hypothetical protein
MPRVGVNAGSALLSEGFLAMAGVWIRTVRLMTAGALVLTVGCATAPPPKPAGPVGPTRQAFITKIQRQFPGEAYLVGFGAGDTAEQAESSARIEAAATISSEIKANLGVIESQSDFNGASSTRREVSQEMVRKVETDAGAFIKVRPELTVKLDDGTFEAVAVANRDELDGKYATDSERLLEKLMLAWGQAINEEKRSPQSVVAALCDARAFEGRLDKLDSERRLVAGRTAWTAVAKARRSEVEALRTRLRSTKVSVVRGSAVPDVEEALFKKFSAAGFPSDLTSKPDCSTGGVVVEVKLIQKCGNSMLGPRCDSSLTAIGNRCDVHDQIFSETSGTGVGMHSSDQELAARASLKKLDTSKFVDAVATRVTKSLEGDCKP